MPIKPALQESWRDDPFGELCPKKVGLVSSILYRASLEGFFVRLVIFVAFGACELIYRRLAYKFILASAFTIPSPSPSRIDPIHTVLCLLGSAVAKHEVFADRGDSWRVPDDVLGYCRQLHAWTHRVSRIAPRCFGGLARISESQNVRCWCPELRGILC